jgi:hypothetical protein
MRNIKIEYKKLIVRRTISKDVPEKWDELSSKQFLAAVRLWVGTISEERFISEIYSMNINIVRRMDSYQRWSLIHAVDFLRNLRIPHNKLFIKKLKGGLCSPGNRLKGCSLLQFMVVDTYFQKYAIDQKDEYLNLFVSSLYKKENECFSVLEFQHPEDQKKAKLVSVEKNKEIVETIDKETKIAIYLNFVLISGWLSKAYPYLFPVPDDDGEVKKNNKKTTNWIDVFDAFVGDDVVEMNRYKAMQATDAFRVMNKRIKNSQKK